MIIPAIYSVQELPCFSARPGTTLEAQVPVPDVVEVPPAPEAPSNGARYSKSN